MKKKLHDIEWFDSKLTESLTDGKDPEWIISGPFMRADIPNGNDRVYPREEADKAINAIRPLIADKRILMLVDHPSWLENGSSLTKVGAILLEITNVDSEGYAHYKAKICNTAVGKDLKAILKEGAKIGVSTRGRGDSNMEEIPGYTGKFEVISNWELKSIDFVDDPAVQDTEAYMKLENKQRSKPEMYKTIDEFKAAQPDMYKSIMDSAKSEQEPKISELEKKQATLEESFKTVVDGIKEIFPEHFKIIQESELVKVKDAAVKSLEEKVTELSKSKTELEESLKTTMSENETKIKEMEKKFNESEMKDYIEFLKVTNPEMFKIEAFKKSFENCMNKEEVMKIFEVQKGLVSEVRDACLPPNTPSEGKTITDIKPPVEEPKTKSPLTDEQTTDMNRRNQTRKVMGMTPFTIEEYLTKFVTN